MKKPFLLTLAILLLASSVLATSFNRIIYPITTKDATDYELKQEKAPDRIVCSSPLITEILYAFLLQDKIVGLTSKCNYPEEAKKAPNVGNDKIEKDKLLKAQPDLVIVDALDKKIDIKSLRELKYNIVSSTETTQVTVEVFAVDPVSLDDVIKNIFTVGTVTNREHSAYSLTERMKRRIEWVAARAKSDKNGFKYRAMVLVNKRDHTFAGKGTYLNDLMRRAGLIDVTKDSKDPLVKMDWREIERANPDVIITSTAVARNPKDIYNNRDFRKTGVNKTRIVVCIDEEIFNRPGPRVTDLIEKIAEVTYGWQNEQNKDKQ